MPDKGKDTPDKGEDTPDKDKADSVNTEAKSEEEKLKRNQKKKIGLTCLIALSYLCMGCYRTIPGPTLLYLKQIVQANLSSMPVIFASRSFGYILGYIIGGVGFDAMRSGHLRHLSIVVVQFISALTAAGVPFCRQISALAATFFIAGFCLSVMDVGFNTYLLFLWKGECHMYFQVLRFVYGVGSIIGPILARSFIKDIQRVWVSNATDAIDVGLGGNMPKLMYAYVVLACMIGVVTVLWFVFMLLPAACYKTSRKLGLSSRIEAKSILIFGVITTAILSFLVGCIDLGYQHMLATFGFTSFGLSTVQSADLTFTFWMCYTIGALIAVFMSYRFHPFFMILCNLLTELLAAIILLFLNKKSRGWLFFGNAILGFGASSLFACTVLWFCSYIKITHKIMAIFLLAAAIAEMVIPSILTHALNYHFRAVFVFLLCLPLLYFIIFLIQCIIFFPYGEKYMSDFGKRHSRLRICPVYLYPPLKQKTMESQTDFDEEDPGEIFEPRSAGTDTQTDFAKPDEEEPAKPEDDGQKPGEEEPAKPEDDGQDEKAVDKLDAPPEKGEEQKKEEQPKDQKKGLFRGLFSKKG